MAAGTLYTYPESFRAYKVLVAAQYAGVNVKLAPNFVFGETNKTEGFLKKFPSGKVPAFETPDGKYLSDSNAIAYLVSSPQLKGSSDFEKAEVLQWITFAETEVLPPTCAWYFPVMGIMQYNKQSFERGREDTKAVLSTLNAHLATRTFLVGERITLGDIAVASALLNLYREVMDPEFRKPHVNVNRWFLTMVNQPQFKTIVGEVKLCSQVAVVDLKKHHQIVGSPKSAEQAAESRKEQTNCKSEPTKSGKRRGKKEKKEQPKKEEKKQTPKKEAEPVEEMDLADAALAEEPKSTDPFATMPKGTFDFDDFKRCYSNEEEAKSIPYFLEKFDPEHYSIWYGEYKYPEELTKIFMSCNLITGMFQRLDKMRKQAFASVCLFGEDSDSTISGIWVWRGQDLVFPLSPDWQIDYEVYDWQKLDASSEDTKKLVQQYFSWTGADKKGRKFNQGKIFK